MRRGKVELEGAVAFPELGEKPLTPGTGSYFLEEKDIKDFDEYKENLVKFSGSETVWTDSWKKYLKDVKTVRDAVRRQVSSNK